MSLLEEQHSFYRERVPAQFNATFAAQAECARADPEARRLLGEMSAVRASIRIEVMSGMMTHAHLLEIDAGVMCDARTGLRPPFLVLRHPLDQFPNLSRRCGASVLGFLGSMAGLGNELKLTSQRVRSLCDLRGSLLFEVEGDDGFSVLAGFGVNELSSVPSASIRLRPEIFEALRSGRLDVQDAFFDEQIDVEGDMQIAIGAALAALAPD